MCKSSFNEQDAYLAIHSPAGASTRAAILFGSGMPLSFPQPSLCAAHIKIIKFRKELCYPTEAKILQIICKIIRKNLIITEEDITVSSNVDSLAGYCYTDPGGSCESSNVYVDGIKVSL